MIRKPPKKSGSKKVSQKESRQEKKAREQFTRDEIMRGGAADLGVDGKLPRGADFEIVGADSKGQPQIKRRRASLK